MIQIKKIGRWAVVEGEIDSRLEAAFFNRLSYKKIGAQYMINPAWAWVRFYNKRKKIFPWGLKNNAIKILEDWKKQTGEEFQFLVNQNETLQEMDAEWSEGFRHYQQNAVWRLFENRGGIVSIPTGGGKTRVALEFLNKVKFKTALVIVHTLDLKKQWQDELDKFNWNVEVCTYQSLKKFKPHHDIVIFDEVHHASCKSLYNIAMNCGKAIVIGLSATPYRADGNEMKMFACIGEIIYSISIRELIDQGYLVDAEIRVTYLPHQEIQLWENYSDVYNKYIVENEERNREVCDIAIKEHSNGLVLILVDKICHGEALKKKLNEIGTDSPISIVFVHGSSKKRAEIFEDVKAGKYNIVIATKIYGEGVNVPNIFTLILANGGKSAIKIVQEIGRVLRIFPGKTKAIIYDFADDCKWLGKHYKARRKIYEETFEVKDL